METVGNVTETDETIVELDSDVLDKSGKSEGQNPRRLGIISRASGNWRHPSSQVPEKDTDTPPPGQHGHLDWG